MNLQDEVRAINPKYEECLRLHKCGTWFLVLGIILMVVGGLAIGSAFIATFTTVVVFGILLMSGGVVQVVNAFLGRSWRGFLLHLLAGLLQLVVGLLMIEQPRRAAEALTFLIALAFMVGGTIRLIFGLVEDFTGRGWVLLNGLITLILGILIWREWPESGLWIIGLFVGIDLMFCGWSWVMLGMLVKAAGPPKTLAKV